MSPADIASALADYKRARVPFDVAWEQAVGPVPSGQVWLRGRLTTESVQRATWRFMRNAYLTIGPQTQHLTSCLADEDTPHRYGGSRRMIA